MDSPKHIAIILDGNRRYAKKLGLQSFKGHEQGAKKVRLLLEWAVPFGIEQLTLYAFSTENFNRDEKEKKAMFGLFSEEFKHLLKPEEQEKLRKQGWRVMFAGRLHLFPANIQEEMRKLMDLTERNGPRTVRFCMGYGGRQEITDAVRKVVEEYQRSGSKPEMICEADVQRNLYFDAEPQIVIRTGAAMRTSNFLPWQSVYSEWFFLDKMWPEFEKADLVNILEEYSKRERRFGK